MGRRILIDPPMQAADRLERKLGRLGRRARRLAVAALGPAVASGDPRRIEDALAQVQSLLDTASPEELTADAADVAAQVDKRHRGLFVAGLAVAVGMKVLGDDAIPAPVPPAVAPAALVPGLATTATTGAPRGVLVAKLSADPILLAERFARENAARITSLHAEVIPALRDEVVRAVQFGIPPDEAAARLTKKWARSGVPVTKGNLEARTRVVVRDQVAKLNSALTRTRSEAAGIREFTWTSQGDDRVRPLHEELDGQRFTFARGHDTEGLPGDPPLCRCYAVPVVTREAVMNSPGFIAIGEGEAAFGLTG